MFGLPAAATTVGVRHEKVTIAVHGSGAPLVKIDRPLPGCVDYRAAIPC